MDLLPVVKRLSILTKDLQVVKLEPNWAQMEYLETVNHQLSTSGRVRIIVLKARQLGLSTITEAVMFSMAFIYERYRGVVIAHDSDASENLLSMTNLYWETYPFRDAYTTKHLSTNHIKWNETGSSIRVATAGNKAAGRSKTIHFLHASEFSFWPDPGVVMLGLRQTIPDSSGTGIVIESTANGVGNLFHSTWEAAVAGDSEYVPLFFPWWKHPEYMASVIGLPYRQLGQLSAEERALKSMGLSDDRLAWRRYAIKSKCDNDLNKFMQEYPATAEEAFISSGTNVFPFQPLHAIYQPQEGICGYLTRDGSKVEFKRDTQGPLKLFKSPNPDRNKGQYFIGADPTQTTKGDFGVAQVLNRVTGEQVAVWRGRIDPGTFAEELFKLGLYFNEAEIAPEKEGPGQLTIGKLLGMNYPNVWRHTKVDRTPGKLTGDLYGWSTTAQTKHLAVSWLLKFVMDKDLIIHDSTTFNEMKNYVTLDNGTYGPAAEDGHDDCVMSLAITVTCHMMTSPPIPVGGGVMVLPEQKHEDKDMIELAWERWGEQTNE